MATYTKASRAVPSFQRSVEIVDVIAGDQIDVVEILGRPARRAKIIPDADSDSIDLRLNNKIVLPTYYDTGERTNESVTVVSQGAQHSVFTLAGATEYLTAEGLQVSFIDIDAISFGGGGTSISIVVW